MWWALGVLAFVLAEFGSHGVQVAADATSFGDALLVIASASPVDRDTGVVDVSYTHPLTNEVVHTAVFARSYLQRRPDGRLDVEVSRTNPDVARFASEHRGYFDDAPFLLIVLLGPLVVWGFRSVHLRRLERLMGGDDPSYSMLATALPPSWLHRRWRLALYALDARTGAEPLSTMELIWLPIRPAGAFAIEVKGAPRPFGRVALRAGGEVLWPRGRTLATRAMVPRPPDVMPFPVPSAVTGGAGTAPSLWPSRLLRIAGLAALLISGVIGSDQTWAAERALERSRPTVATVISSSGDFGSTRAAVVSYQAGGSIQTSRMDVERLVVDQGVQIPARYDASNPSRLWEASRRGPPDPRGEAIVFGAFVVGVGLLAAAASRRRQELKALGLHELETTGRVTFGTLPHE